MTQETETGAATAARTKGTALFIWEGYIDSKPVLDRMMPVYCKRDAEQRVEELKARKPNDEKSETSAERYNAFFTDYLITPYWR